MAKPPNKYDGIAGGKEATKPRLPRFPSRHSTRRGQSMGYNMPRCQEVQVPSKGLKANMWLPSHQSKSLNHGIITSRNLWQKPANECPKDRPIREYPYSNIGEPSSLPSNISCSAPRQEAYIWHFRDFCLAVLSSGKGHQREGCSPPGLFFRIRHLDAGSSPICCF